MTVEVLDLVYAWFQVPIHKDGRRIGGRSDEHGYNKEERDTESGQSWQWAPSCYTYVRHTFPGVLPISERPSHIKQGQYSKREHIREFLTLP